MIGSWRQIIILVLTLIAIGGIVALLQSLLHEFGKRNERDYIADTLANQIVDKATCLFILIGFVILLALCGILALEFVMWVAHVVVGD